MSLRVVSLAFVMLLTGLVPVRADGFGKLRVSTPLILSGATGYRFGRDHSVARPVVELEAGVGGGKVAVGLDRIGGHDLGYAVRGVLLRTWIEPIGVDENQSFLGVEGEISIKRLLFHAGGYRRISSGDDNWLAGAGVGVLF